MRREASGDYDLSRLAHAAGRDGSPAPSARATAAQALLFWLVLRLKYVLLAVPIVALALGVYAGVYASFTEASKVPVDVTLLPPIITCVFFVLSIVFSNVIADYKESEKIPADLVSYFAAIAAFAVAEARQRGFSARPMLLQVQAMLLCVLSTLDKKRGYVADLRAFNEAVVTFKILARAQGVHEMEIPEHAAGEVVKKITRIHDIGRLSIILPACACAGRQRRRRRGVHGEICACAASPPCHHSPCPPLASLPTDTLMDILVVALAAIVITVDYKNEFTNFAAISVLLTVAVYMSLLVHGLDDPFDGPDEYHFRCYCTRSEIELSYAEAWKYGLSVNFACLTADFGNVLRRLIAEADGNAAAAAELGAATSLSEHALH